MLFSNAPGDLPPESQALRDHIIQEADNTVNMDDPFERKYRVPHELIISAMQVYDATKHNYSTEKAVTMMADILAPVMEYEDYEGEIETVRTTCQDGECETTTEKTPFTLRYLVSLQAWDRVVTRTIESYTTDWVVTERSDGEGGTTTTETRSHTYKHEEFEVIDYTLFDTVLSESPFSYGQEDKYTVEAVYHATGGEINYREWLTQNSIIGGGFDGTVIPGSSVPIEFMEYYLGAEKKFGVDWYYIAAIHYMETKFSTHKPMISSAGAEGHMQFMPCTWLGWDYPGCKGGKGYVAVSDSIKHSLAQIKKYGGLGVDANGDGKASPWDIADAIYSAANLLRYNGYATNIRNAIWKYNNSTKYVNDVTKMAEKFKEEAQYMANSGEIPDLKPGSFMKPTVARVSSGYGYRWGRLHAGLDFANPKQPPIVAVADGVVIRAHTGCPPKGYYGSKCGGEWGNHTIIRHTVQGRTYDAVYAHFHQLDIRMGQTVRQGQYLGIMGMSGSSTGIHLHFELHPGRRVNKNTSVNPALYLPI